MKTMFAVILISLLTFSCALLEEMPEDRCTENCGDGMQKLSLIERQRLAERSGIPRHFWDDKKFSFSLARALREKYQLSNADFTAERNGEP